MLKNWRKFEITEILLQIFANFLKRKEPTFTSQLLIIIMLYEHNYKS